MSNQSLVWDLRKKKQSSRQKLDCRSPLIDAKRRRWVVHIVGISREIDVNISRLKEKLSSAGLSKDIIISLCGKGYMLDSSKITEILSLEEKDYIAEL